MPLPATSQGLADLLGLARMDSEPRDRTGDEREGSESTSDFHLTRLFPLAAQVGWGDYWVRGASFDGLWIFGQVATEAEGSFFTHLRDAQERDASRVEEALLRQAYRRGYRYGRAYSMMCLEGELGSTHIAHMLGPITLEEFQLARELRWDIQKILTADVAFAQKVARYLHERGKIGRYVAQRLPEE